LWWEKGAYRAGITEAEFHELYGKLVEMLEPEDSVDTGKMVS
jgi:hypothetical protein